MRRLKSAYPIANISSTTRPWQTGVLKRMEISQFQLQQVNQQSFWYIILRVRIARLATQCRPLANESVLGADDLSGPVFPISQWQPNDVGRNKKVMKAD